MDDVDFDDDDEDDGVVDVDTTANDTTLDDAELEDEEELNRLEDEMVNWLFDNGFGEYEQDILEVRAFEKRRSCSCSCRCIVGVVVRAVSSSYSTSFLFDLSVGPLNLNLTFF